MDKLERIRERRDEYESAMDDAERLRDEYHREIVKLHRSGMSLREIAEGLGISHQRVHQIVAPLEERSGARRGRGKAIGAAGVVVLILLTGSLWFSRSHGDPVTQRLAPAANGGQGSQPLTQPCLLHVGGRSTFSPITAAAQCVERAVVALLDPKTGRVLGYVGDPRTVTTIDPALQRRVQEQLPG